MDECLELRQVKSAVFIMPVRKTRSCWLASMISFFPRASDLESMVARVWIFPVRRDEGILPILAFKSPPIITSSPTDLK